MDTDTETRNENAEFSGAVQIEMKRIKNLFDTSEGDSEDLITYAKEIALMRSNLTRFT
tara:strand:+ start:370 stop:543 length:174 start_codon:yes stop_codon:yes gene_type:complete